MRIDPPPSLPVAAATRPAATAAALPPLAAAGAAPPGAARAGGGAAAAGAAGGAGEVPRVAGVAAARALGERPLPELRHPGLPDDDRPGLLQPPHQVGVGRRGPGP